jgi:hypothetical protein
LVAITNCPICGIRAQGRDDFDRQMFECNRCGLFQCRRRTWDEIIALTDLTHRSVLSHLVRRQQNGGEKFPMLALDIVAQSKGQKLPSPHEQADNMLLWIGDHQSAPQEPATITDAGMGAVTGTQLSADHVERGVHWLLGEFANEGLFVAELNVGADPRSYTDHGWMDKAR